MAFGLAPSKFPLLQDEQNDSAHESDRANDGRYEMAVGCRDVNAEDVNRLSRGFECDARVGEHDDPECDQKDGDEGFGVHLKQLKLAEAWLFSQPARGQQ
jgi:hypothetical protein